MKSFTQGNYKMALASLRSTRWRSMLTMLGIVIGVVSVITIVSIGEGVKRQVVGQINHLGKDLITIRPGQQSDQVSVNFLSRAAGTGSLSAHDVATVSKTKYVGSVVPMSVVGGTITDTPGKDPSAVVVGTGDSLPTVLNQTVAFGNFFASEDDGQNVAVIGAQVASDMFGEDVPLGQSFTFHGQTFIVRGVMNEFAKSPLSLDVDYNNAIFIPYSTAQALTNNTAAIYEILAKPSSANATDSAVTNIRSTLNKAHGDQQDFTVLRQNQNLAVSNSVLSLLTGLVGGVAAISLLVGGIGIMNVMLVSVTERMHEIGIRKAVGATNRQILNQFIVEATLLSVFGGILGVIISFIIDGILHIFTNLAPVITWQVVLVSTGVTLIIGVVFGSAPAFKAARKDPIDALRNE